MADIQIEVAYAAPQKQWVLPVTIPTTATVKQAIELSGILQQFPEIDLNAHPVGIFSRLVDLDSTLQAGDRIEIYRQLTADPKIKRHLRSNITSSCHSPT